MKLKSKYIFTAITIAVAGLLGFGSRYIGEGDDNPVEEAAEAVIEGQIEDSLNLPQGSRR